MNGTRNWHLFIHTRRDFNHSKIFFALYHRQINFYNGNSILAIECPLIFTLKTIGNYIFLSFFPESLSSGLPNPLTKILTDLFRRGTKEQF